jgi:hypothetical protein
MDQATATVLAAVIVLSGTVTAAIIGKWKSSREPQHHIHEYHISYPMQVEHEPWIRGTSGLARFIRAVGWIVATALIFFGINTLFWMAAIITGWPLFDDLKLPNQKLVVIAFLPSGVLALIAARWITNRIEIPRETDDADDDD